MLRNPAYREQAAFGKTKMSERHGKPTRVTRRRGERHGRRPARQDEPAEAWTLIPVPALVTDEQFERAQERLAENARSGFTHVADRAVAPAPLRTRLSTTHEGIATGDPGISPDRTRTGRPP
jgi:hypothetical protein